MKKLYTQVKIFKKILFFLFLFAMSKTAFAQQSAGCHAGFTFVVSGHTVIFNDTSFFDVGPQNTTWLWNFGDGSTDTAQHPSHTFSTPPNQYTICLVVTNCAILPGTCCTDTVCHLVEFGDPAGIIHSSLIADNIHIFPNPVSKNFSLGFSLSGTSAIVLQITDAAGRVCHLSEAINFSAGDQIIHFNENILPSKGLYFLHVIADSKPAATLKLAKW